MCSRSTSTAVIPKSMFFTIPRELRDNVYFELVGHMKFKPSIVRQSNSHHSHQQLRDQIMSFLLVSKQFHDEVENSIFMHVSFTVCVNPRPSYAWNNRGYTLKDYSLPTHLIHPRTYTFDLHQSTIKHWDDSLWVKAYNRVEIKALAKYRRVRILLDDAIFGLRQHVLPYCPPPKSGSQAAKRRKLWSEEENIARAVRDFVVVLHANSRWQQPDWTIRGLEDHSFKNEHPVEYYQMKLMLNWGKLTGAEKKLAIDEINAKEAIASTIRSSI